MLIHQVNLHIIFLQVSQRNVPGIDCSYLAMDTEEGVEVVWNEVLFSETRKEKHEFKNKEVENKLCYKQQDYIIWCSVGPHFKAKNLVLAAAKGIPPPSLLLLFSST